jgi:hypothetical protein
MKRARKLFLNSNEGHECNTFCGVCPYQRVDNSTDSLWFLYNEHRTQASQTAATLDLKDLSRIDVARHFGAS